MIEVGVNVTFTVQLVLRSRLLPQVLVWAKSPLVENEEKVITSVPVFVRVTAFRAAVVRSTVRGNVSDAGITVKAAPALMPVPVMETVCGLFGALSVIMRSALSLARSVGLNVTLTVQLAWGETVPVQLFVMP